MKNMTCLSSNQSRESTIIWKVSWKMQFWLYTIFLPNSYHTRGTLMLHISFFAKKKKKYVFVLASGVVGENNEIYCIVLCILEILFFGCKSLRNQSKTCYHERNKYAKNFWCWGNIFSYCSSKVYLGTK